MRLKGPFLRFVADTLYLVDDRVGNRALPADSFRTVWVRGNASGAGAGLGGAPIGYGIGSLIETWDQKYPKQEKTGPSRQ